MFTNILYGPTDTALPTLEFRSLKLDSGELAMSILIQDGQHILIGRQLAGNSTVRLESKHIETGERNTVMEIPYLNAGVVGDLSPDGRRFVFSNGSHNAWFKEQGLPQGIFVQTKGDLKPQKIADVGYAPKWSPDGKRIVFCIGVVTLVGEENAVYVYDLEENLLQKISPDNGLQFAEPSWSPDSRWIVCVGGLGSRWEIWLIEAASGDVHKISSLSTWIRHPVWPKSSEFIYFLADNDLWRTRIDRDEGVFRGISEQLTTAQDFDYLNVAPSGDRFLLRKSIARAQIEVFASSGDTAFSSPTRRGVTDNLVTGDFDISPDDSQLVAESPVSGISRSLLLISTRDGMETTLYDEQAAFAPSWSADGAWIAFDAGGGNNADIWRISASGGEAEKIIASSGADWLPTYSPVGRRLCFVSNRSGQFDLWIKDLASGEVSQLTNTEHLESRGFWSQDGQKLAFFEIRSSRDSSAIWTYDFSDKHFEKIISVAPQERTVEILDKLAWLSKDELFFWSDKRDAFVTVSIRSRELRSVFSGVRSRGYSGGRLFALSQRYFYCTLSQNASSFVIADLRK